MFLDISDIAPAGLAFDRGLVLPPMEGAGGDRVEVVEARLVGRIQKTSRAWEFRARLTASLRLECSRCLDPFPSPMEVDVALTLVPEAKGAAEGRYLAAADDDSAFPVLEGKLDLAAVASEQIVLNLPLKPICGGDCKGLCPECGANRNRQVCDCTPPPLDPRLAPLLPFRPARPSRR